jgi:hypothetical protein
VLGCPDADTISICGIARRVQMVGFKLRLGETYWAKGFFNVPVAFERYVSQDDGPVDLYLGTTGVPVSGRMTRRANLNATPRVFGGRPLQDFFQTVKQGEFVFVEFISPRSMRIGGAEADAPNPRRPSVQLAKPRRSQVSGSAKDAEPPAGSAVAQSLSVADLGDLKRKLEALLDTVESGGRIPGEGVRRRVNRLSWNGNPIPRDIAALMITITEMRNSAEHEMKVLSVAESATVRNAWQAIREWAQSARRRS